jgi:L-cysteate sulfo-lyase
MSVLDSRPDLVRLRAGIDRLPRYSLSHLPTPLEHLPRFSRQLGGPEIYIKRDDCTGLLFGGNKARHNEFLLGDALAKRADTFVWGAGVQSNNCRQTAAACAKAGLDCYLVLGRGDAALGIEPPQGNLLLDHIVGAIVQIVDEAVGPALDARIDELAAELREQGRRVYAWDRHIVKPLAAVSYVLCLVEIVEQSAVAGFVPDAVYVSSSGSTGSGLALGAAALDRPLPVRSIAPMIWPWDTQDDMARIANQAAELMGVDTRLAAADVDVSNDYVSPGYGQPSPAGLEAIALLARTEGILLDPIYSGKAMAALIDHIRNDRLTADQKVVFVHTGGTPAVFAYHEEMAAGITPRTGGDKRT